MFTHHAVFLRFLTNRGYLNYQTPFQMHQNSLEKWNLIFGKSACAI